MGGGDPMMGARSGSPAPMSAVAALRMGQHPQGHMSPLGVDAGMQRGAPSHGSHMMGGPNAAVGGGGVMGGQGPMPQGSAVRGAGGPNPGGVGGLTNQQQHELLAHAARLPGSAAAVAAAQHQMQHQHQHQQVRQHPQQGQVTVPPQQMQPSHQQQQQVQQARAQAQAAALRQAQHSRPAQGIQQGGAPVPQLNSYGGMPSQAAVPAGMGLTGSSMPPSSSGMVLQQAPPQQPPPQASLQPPPQPQPVSAPVASAAGAMGNVGMYSMSPHAGGGGNAQFSQHPGPGGGMTMPPQGAPMISQAPPQGMTGSPSAAVRSSMAPMPSVQGSSVLGRSITPPLQNVTVPVSGASGVMLSQQPPAPSDQMG
ncbi:hypothetical protein CYMTET_22447 [Cymbomonas tetramitiformis]|uniref:Uncharacterized protein n=1 Tax=Cymbomonas tetramitiformis TaxID=36881 RepID=A0AAE0L1Z5_9CHLO|nr:hypothetical protein CYMTET_22447 [Cymbomonas tetramitiformis]